MRGCGSGGSNAAKPWTPRRCPRPRRYCGKRKKTVPKQSRGSPFQCCLAKPQYPERVTRGASFYPQSTFPWGASLCAGNRGSLQRLSSVVDGLVTRFTVRRGRRRCAAVFIDRRRSHGALHSTPGAQAFCTGARKHWPFGGDPMPAVFTIWGQQPITVWGLQPMSPCGRPAISSG